MEALHGHGFTDCSVTEMKQDRRSSAHPSATGLWIRVLMRSRGWKMTVEQVPLSEPAKNDLMTGD